MQHSQIVDELIVLLNGIHEKPQKIAASTALITDLGLESIQVIEYLCEVEDRFDMIIDEESIANVRTIGDLADVVLKLRQD
jgi:acyl carrier protein